MPRRPRLSIDGQLLSIARRMTEDVALVVRRYVAEEVRNALKGRSLKDIPSQPRRTTNRNGKALQARLLTILAGSKKGLPLGEIVKRTGTSRESMKYHLRALRAQKRTRLVGDRKKARWFAT